MVPDSTQIISRVAGACASPPNVSPGITSQRHSSTAHGGSVAPMIVPVPPEGPRQSTREASGLLIRTPGSPPTSTSSVTGTPNASPIRARVARLGLDRPCSSATSTPLLTPDRVASWSRDQPRSARRACRVRATAAVMPGTSAIYSLPDAPGGRYNELYRSIFRPASLVPEETDRGDNPG